MAYLTDRNQIQDAIAHYTHAKILWVDIEAADYLTKNPKLSLIQVLDDGEDRTGDRVKIFDVLHQPDVAQEFIEKIIINPQIEKVFHNASFDLKFLGRDRAQTITCTWEMAKKLPLFMIPTSSLKLKTLAVELCGFAPEKSEQGSDWGQRPLSDSQLRYATMDPVYLAQVHQHLLQVQQQSQFHPTTDDAIALSQRYLECKQQLKILNSEVDYLENRLKHAMQAQNIQETDAIKLSSAERTSYKVPFSQLAKLIVNQNLDFDFSITLTKQLRAQLDAFLNELPIEPETTTTWKLTPKKPNHEEATDSEN